MIWRKEQPPAHQEHEGPRGFDDYELRLGDLLRGERATLSKSLLDVQRELHIRATYIAAIENGDLSVFETPSFVAGFVRSYARYLGMDPEWVYDRFCMEHGFAVNHGMAGFARDSAPTPAGPAAAPRRAQPSGIGAPLKGVGLLPDPEPFWRRVEPGALGSVSILAALILGLGFAGWTVLQEVQRVQVAPADFAPTVLSDIDPLADTGIAMRDTPEAPVTSDTNAPERAAASRLDADQDRQPIEGRVRVARPQALDAPVMVPRDGPIAAISPRDERSPAVISADRAVSEALADQLAESGTPAPQVHDAAPPAVEILAVRPSWVRVRGADNSVIFERILDAGERYTIPQTEVPPTLHAGNSGSVYFLIDGQPYGPAAPGAQVVRNMALSVDALRERLAQADLSRDADLAVHVARLTEPAD
ncbi:MAG: helix-turn-helix domain-containing protein [Pararhodobacter sp.]